MAARTEDGLIVFPGRSAEGSDAGGQNFDLATVTEFLREKGVAEFKIPLEMVLVEELPRTAVGKINRRALEAMLRAPATSSPARTGKAPGSFPAALALVRECVARLLGLESG